ncbi:hypothetical protein ACQJBY_012235 [Aegilops geniculata]
MASPRVAGASSAVPARRRQARSCLPAASSPFLANSFRPHRNRRNQPLGLASAHAARRDFTGAHSPEFFSRRHHRPPLYSLCVRSTQTMSHSCSAERSLVGQNASPQNKEREARIKKKLQNPELPPSPYDTAWVAMVPLRDYQRAPRFPQCVEWILQNQQDNGSWGNGEFDSSTNKSILLSTLACVIALKKWNVGPEHIKRGLHFVGKKFSLSMDEQIAAPIGFNITFPGMISLAIEMGLEFPVKQIDVDGILSIWQMELQRFVGDKSDGREAYMAYVAEGLGKLLDWNEVLKFQRKNGSLFNSPSTTAAALIYHYDEKALQYLNFLVSKFGSAVPTVFPTNISCQLSMVDSLEKIGISRHFSSEIKSILDMTYSLWLQRDEEILLDVATCAMAFRILRMNGYDVSSDELSHVAEASTFCNSLQGYLDDTKSLLELYKASRVSLSENELILDNIGCWSGGLLLKKLCSGGVHREPIFGEVEDALNFPFYATMERLDHRRNIEHFNVMGSQMLKATYLPCHVYKDHLALAVEDFTFSQIIYQDELLHLESWVKENRLDQLQFARPKLTYCYLSASATIFPRELSDARITWAKRSVLSSISDDFFDVGGSREELENLVALVEKWDEHQELQFYSERVKILFCAIYTTVNRIGEMAFAVQNRDVRKHLIELWIDALRSMMTEAEWARSQYLPTTDEYMTNANVSYIMGPIVLPPLYFVGQELLESVVKDQEYDELFRLMSTNGRLLNDIQSFEREDSQGKVNSVSLLILQSGGSMSTETAKKVIQESIASCRRELLRLVLREDSVVPRPCKELFWKMCKINELFYSQTDGYSSPTEMVGAVNAVIYEPLKLQISNPSSAVKAEK